MKLLRKRCYEKLQQQALELMAFLRMACPVIMVAALSIDGYASNFFESSNSAAATFTSTLATWYNTSVFPIGLIVTLIGLAICGITGMSKGIQLFKIGLGIVIVVFIGVNLLDLIVETCDWIVNTIKGGVTSGSEV